MSQELRNKIYAVLGGAGVIAVAVGLATSEQVQSLTDLLSRLLDQGVEIATTLGLVLAFFKSRPSRVTTIEAPKAEVTQVVQVDGQLVEDSVDLDAEDEESALSEEG